MTDAETEGTEECCSVPVRKLRVLCKTMTNLEGLADGAVEEYYAPESTSSLMENSYLSTLLTTFRRECLTLVVVLGRNELAISTEVLPRLGWWMRFLPRTNQAKTMIPSRSRT